MKCLLDSLNTSELQKQQLRNPLYLCFLMALSFSLWLFAPTGQHVITLKNSTYNYIHAVVNTQNKTATIEMKQNKR